MAWLDNGPEFESAKSVALPYISPRDAMVCTPRQARLAMMQTPYGEYPSLLTAVEAAIYTSGDPALAVAWEYATEWRRDAPEISAIGAALGLSSDEIDALFARAMAL